MKKLIYIITVGLLLGTTACKKDFDKINTNVNSPIDVQPGLLLRQVIYDYAEQMSYEGFVAGNLLSQNLAMTDFNLFDRHALSQPQLGGNPWPIIYQNLRDNEILLNKAKAENIYKVYQGPAMILKAYMAQALTDIYGDVPFSEALKGLEGNAAPKYDAQSDIYLGTDGILSLLDQAIAAIDAYQDVYSLDGDLLFNGDLTKWRQMANSLKIKALMRISLKDADITLDVAQELQSIFSAGDYIQTNADNGVFVFSGSRPNSFRMQKLRVGDFNQFVMSQLSDTILGELNDPRIDVFFRLSNDQVDADGYNGLINGIDASSTSIVSANYSAAGTLFREDTEGLQANLITAWETAFLLAEAAERGFIAASAQTLYNDAVTMAFDYWGTALPATYLTVGPAAYTTGDPIEQIMTQKWIANTINGYESWIEYRRTGFPQLLNVAASLNGGLIPVRMPYPTDEAALNAANYNEASAATNGNSINSKVWWDVN